MKKKLSKIIIPLIMCTMLGMSAIGEFSKVMAMPATSVTQAELDKCKGMTFEQLNTIAKPMPKECVNTINGIDSFQNVGALPQDGNIYYIKNIKGSTTTVQFLKFLYATPTTTVNCVDYHYYIWSAANSIIDPKWTGKTVSSHSDVDLYNQLIGKSRSSQNGSINTTQTSGQAYTGAYKTSITQAELDKDKSMTVEQLKAVAKPMPDECTDTVAGGTTTQNMNKFPNDGNIYYIENNSNGTSIIQYFKLLYVTPSTVPENVDYHFYIWTSIDGVIDTKWSKEVTNSASNRELYNKLIGKNSVLDKSSTDVNTNVNKKKYSKKRIGGLTRVSTSSLISEEFNNGTVQNVILTNGYGFADALSGSVLAKKLNSPVLLVGSSPEDSTDTMNYIKNHLDKNGTIFILGGESSVNSKFIDSITAMGYSNIKRLAGNNRYETNAAINNTLNVTTGTPIVITNGEGFADALSISSIASNKGFPIVLSGKDNLTQQAINTIKTVQPSQIYVIGGVGSISDEVKEQIKSITSLSDDKIIRISGNTRYETSLNIAKYFNLDTDTVILANGEGFADALSGAILGTKHNAPIILLSGDISAQKQYLDSTKYTNEIILGGSGSVSESQESELTK